jgi:hypothetical protein
MSNRLKSGMGPKDTENEQQVGMVGRNIFILCGIFSSGKCRKSRFLFTTNVLIFLTLFSKVRESPARRNGATCYFCVIFRSFNTNRSPNP